VRIPCPSPWQATVMDREQVPVRHAYDAATGYILGLTECIIVSMAALKKVHETQESLRVQFTEHNCNPQVAS
jgi:hypothetical protein